MEDAHANQTEASRIVWWLLSGLLGLCLAAGGVVVTSMASEARETRTELAGHHHAGIETDIKYIREALQRIDAALGQLAGKGKR